MYQLNIKNKLKISIPPVHGIFIEKPKKPKFNGGTKKTKTKTKTKKTRIIYKK
jgi:hypothetical protein